MSYDPMQYTFELLTELRDRIPPQQDMRHNITLTYDGRLELTTFARDYPFQVFMFDPEDDKEMSPTDVVDYIENTLKNLPTEE